MRCPNKNLPEWKSLVERVGELEAYLLYVDNDFNIPGEEVEFSNSLYDSIDKELVEKLREGTNLRAKILQNLSLKFQLMSSKKENENVKSVKKDIKEQIKLLNDSSVESAFFEFMKHSSKALDQYNKMIDSNKTDLDLIKKIEVYSGAYDVISEIGKHLRKHYDNPDALQVSREVEGKLKQVRDNYLDIVEKELPKKLAKNSNIVRNHYKQKIRATYVRTNPKKTEESKEDFNERVDNYVAKEIESNEGKIQYEEEEYVKNLLLSAPKDLGAIESYMVDGRAMDDHLIQLAVDLLDKADFNTKEEFIVDRKKYYDKFSEITNKMNIQSFGKDNMEKMYGDVIERDKDGKITGYLTSEIYSEYFDTALKELYELLALPKDKLRKEKIAKWKKENLKGNPKGKKPYLNPKYLADKWKNPQYENLKKDENRTELSELFKEMALNSDQATSYRSRISNYKIGDGVGYVKIPSLTKEFIENSQTNGFVAALKQSVKDSFIIQSDDVEFGDELHRNLIYGNEKGKPIDRISMPFRNKIDSKDLSLDLFNSFMTNHYVSLNYKNKDGIKTDLLITKDLVEERGKFVKRVDGNVLQQKINDFFKIDIEEQREIEEESKKSNRLKVLSSILEDRLLGISSVYGGKIIGNISIDKTANTLMKASANNFLAFNYMGAAANTLQGKVMNLLAAQNGKHFNKKGLLKAENKYRKDFSEIVKDTTNYIKSSKTNQLNEKFLDTSMNFSFYNNNVYNNKKFRREIGQSWANGMNEGAEHWIQSTLMYAVLGNIKIKNKNGEYINKEGNVVSKKDAMSLDEAYELKDGLLHLNENYVVEGMENMSKIEMEQKISARMKEVASNLYGNFDNRNKAMIQRYWYGKLMMFMRKWIVRTIMNRYQGISTFNKSIEELELDEKSHSIGLDGFQEGTYTTFVRFVNNQRKKGQMLSFMLMTSDFESMTEEEKGNIRQAVLEMLIMGVAMTSSFLLTKLADDLDEEEEKIVYHFIYLSERLKSEIQFYIPLMNTREVLRTMNTPSSALHTLSLVGQLFEQFFSFTETYETGRNRGKNKFLNTVRKLVDPFYKNLLNRDIKTSTNYLKNGR
jgi:hypothetical protein